MRTDYLIIGNSAGGIGAAEAIREVDKTGHLTIISDEPYPAYSRPLISKYLAGERTFEDMLFRPAEFYSQSNIHSLLGQKVKGLALESRTVELDSGEKVVWKRLLLAPGGKPIFPRIKGADKEAVFTFTTFDDARAISSFLERKSCKAATVIGGGLIGVSAAEALVKRHVEVTVVEMKERILNTILDEQASRLAAQALRQAGVKIVAGHTVAEISGEATGRKAFLDNGEEIPSDLIVVAIGVSPRLELTAGTGIGVNRGIVVNRQMATSSPDVYACGDAAEAYDFVQGKNSLTPIWPNAYLGGRIAGLNMAGAKAEYPGGTAMNSLNYFGLDIAAAGIVTPPDDKASQDIWEVITRQTDSTYQKVVLQRDRIVGMILVRDIERSGILFSLMREQVKVGSFKQALLADEFGLASLPRALRQQRLGAPQPESLQQQTPEVEARRARSTRQ